MRRSEDAWQGMQGLRRVLFFLFLLMPFGCGQEQTIDPHNPARSIRMIEAQLSEEQRQEFRASLELVLQAHLPDSLFAQLEHPDTADTDPDLFAPVFGKTAEEVTAMADSIRQQPGDAIE